MGGFFLKWISLGFEPTGVNQFSVGRVLESDILGIAAMDCNDGNVKGFVGYKYPIYACCIFAWQGQNTVAMLVAIYLLI